MEFTIAMLKKACRGNICEIIQTDKIATEMLYKSSNIRQPESFTLNPFGKFFSILKREAVPIFVEIPAFRWAILQ